MWVMMLISFFTVAYIDTRGFSKLKDKKTLIVYTMLMTASCIIGTANGYVRYMPSPSEPIRNIVLFIIGK